MTAVSKEISRLIEISELIVVKVSREKRTVINIPVPPGKPFSHFVPNPSNLQEAILLIEKMTVETDLLGPDFSDITFSVSMKYSPQFKMVEVNVLNCYFGCLKQLETNYSLAGFSIKSEFAPSFARLDSGSEFTNRSLIDSRANKGGINDKGYHYSVKYVRMDEDGKELSSICLRRYNDRDTALEFGSKLAEVLGLKENGTPKPDEDFTEYAWMTIIPTEADEYVVVTKEK